MNTLDNWLVQATRRLAAASAAQVRTEIQDHYQSARAAAVTAGVSAEEANSVALQALGDPKTANCHYRRVLLTAEEARALREGASEARLFCGRRKWLAVPVIAAVPAGLFLTGHSDVARDCSVIAAFLITWLAATALPIYTPGRGQAFRIVKWIALLVIFTLIFRPIAKQASWLLFIGLWPMASSETIRASIRRKLPVGAWPKHLYF